jgi:hypothetical protein
MSSCRSLACNSKRKVVQAWIRGREAAPAPLDPELDQEGIELEAELTAKYGFIEEAPAYDELVR